MNTNETNIYWVAAMYQGTVLYYFGDMKIKKDIIFANSALRELRREMSRQAIL